MMNVAVKILVWLLAITVFVLPVGCFGWFFITDELAYHPEVLAAVTALLVLWFVAWIATLMWLAMRCTVDKTFWLLVTLFVPYFGMVMYWTKRKTVAAPAATAD